MFKIGGNIQQIVTKLEYHRDMSEHNFIPIKQIKEID